MRDMQAHCPPRYDTRVVRPRSSWTARVRRAGRRLQHRFAGESECTHLGPACGLDGRAAESETGAATALPAETTKLNFDTLRVQFATRRIVRRRGEVSAREAAHAEDPDAAQAVLTGEEHAQQKIYFGHISRVHPLLRTRRIPRLARTA